MATLTVDLPGFEPQNGRQLSSEWLVSGRVARKRAMSGRAVVHVNVLTGTHAPGALWSDTMSGQKGVRPTASVTTFVDRMLAVTREIAPCACVTDSLPLKRAEGRFPKPPPTQPVVASTQVGTRAEAVPRGSELPSAAQSRVLAWRCPTRRRVGNQDVERQGCWTMKGPRWLRAVEAGGGITRYPELRSWSGRTQSTLPVRNG